MDKKILVTTMDCWSRLNSATTADTFEKLLLNYNRDKIVGLYLNEEIPTSKRCVRYYAISENKIIRSIYRPGVETGTIYSESDSKEDENQKAELEKRKKRYVRFEKKRRYVFLWIRELIWKLGRWKTPLLKQFLETEKPDVILFGLEGYGYFNRINRYIIKKTKAKAIGFFWDDNFTYLQRKKTIGFLLHRYNQRRSLRRTVKMCSDFFAISEKTKQEADAMFRINCKVLTKPVEDNVRELYHIQNSGNKKIKLVYTGNLKIGRFDTLTYISNVFDANEQLQKSFELDVYSSTFIEPEQLGKLNSAIHFKGMIPKEEVEKVQEAADILLLLEDMAGEHALSSRLSFSTKVTDYLGMRKAIFMVANRHTATMEYFMKEECAFCVSNEKEIEEKLKEILAMPTLIETYAERAYKLGQERHSRQKMEQIFYETINGLFEE